MWWWAKWRQQPFSQSVCKSINQTSFIHVVLGTTSKHVRQLSKLNAFSGTCTRKVCTRKTELTLEVKCYLCVHRVQIVMRRMLISGGNTKYIFPWCQRKRAPRKRGKLTPCANSEKRGKRARAQTKKTRETYVGRRLVKARETCADASPNGAGSSLPFLYLM